MIFPRSLMATGFLSKQMSYFGIVFAIVVPGALYLYAEFGRGGSGPSSALSVKEVQHRLSKVGNFTPYWLGLRTGRWPLIHADGDRRHSKNYPEGHAYFAYGDDSYSYSVELNETPYNTREGSSQWKTPHVRIVRLGNGMVAKVSTGFVVVRASNTVIDVRDDEHRTVAEEAQWLAENLRPLESAP